MFGAIAGGIAFALSGGTSFKLFGGGKKVASGGIQGDVLATDNNTVGMGYAGIKSAIFFFQAEDGIRDHCVTGVQTCALPISSAEMRRARKFAAWPMSNHRRLSA